MNNSTLTVSPPSTWFIVSQYDFSIHPSACLHYRNYTVHDRLAASWLLSQSKTTYLHQSHTTYCLQSIARSLPGPKQNNNLQGKGEVQLQQSAC